MSGKTTIEDITEALKRVRREFGPTPLTHSPFLSELVGHAVYIKWDNKLRTGSFKERGAINYLQSLSEEDRKKGVCAASAGNHAMAVSYYASKLKVPCTIVMPTWAPLIKVQSTSKFGANVILHGHSFDEAYAEAQAIAEREKSFFVSAFDDYKVIAGQGTLGLELFEQLSDFDSVIVPIGGGGLIAGVATAIKAKNSSIDVIGVQSEWIVRKRDFSEYAKNSPLPPSTIADGIAVKKIGEKTGPIITEHVRSIVTVTENQIADAITKLLELEKTVVEGAGAAGIAALLSKLISSHYKKSVVVVCGSNIDMDLLYRLIVRDMAKRDRLLKMITSVPDRPGSLLYVTGIIAAAGANVLEVIHDRSFAEVPGNVSISFVLEVRDSAHKKQVLEAFQEKDILVSTSSYS